MSLDRGRFPRARPGHRAQRGGHIVPVAIENKTRGRVLLRFNSGVTRHLAPGETLQDVDRVEVKGNAWLSHLEERRVIAVKMPQEERQQPGAARRVRSKEMREKDAIAHIQGTSLVELQDFLSPGEDRVRVLRAYEDKRGR
jgi:hypothetical protein